MPGTAASASCPSTAASTYRSSISKHWSHVSSGPAGPRIRAIRSDIFRSWDIESELLEMHAQLPAGVVERLVEGAAGRVQPLGEDVDRHAIESRGHEHGALVLGELLVDRLAQRLDQRAGLAAQIGTGIGGRQRFEAVLRHWQLTALPRTAPEPHADLEQCELVRPGREAAVATESVELVQDRDQSVIGALIGEIIGVREGCAAPVDLETGGTQQQLVQLLDRLGAPGAERFDPRVDQLGHGIHTGHGSHYTVSDAGSAFLTSYLRRTMGRGGLRGPPSRDRRGILPGGADRLHPARLARAVPPAGRLLPRRGGGDDVRMRYRVRR